MDTTANSIVVEDLTGDLETVRWTGEKAELCGAGSLTATGPIAGFVPSRGSTGASLRSVSLRSIFAFNDSKQANAPTYQTHGTWTSAPSFASSQTTFTDVDADDNGGGFASWMIGSILVPDVNIGAPLIITGATATTLTVAGDARGVAGNGSRYIVYAAPFTDPVRGTWQTDPHKGGTRYLWAGYRYQPPQMGFWVDPPGAAGLGVYGAATGTNRLGQYYCWNRTYDINTGRWTTPDPVATPWWNLGSYPNAPTRDFDPTGNEPISASTLAAVAAACIGAHITYYALKWTVEAAVDDKKVECKDIWGALINTTVNCMLTVALAWLGGPSVVAAVRGKALEKIVAVLLGEGVVAGLWMFTADVLVEKIAEKLCEKSPAERAEAAKAAAGAPGGKRVIHYIIPPEYRSAGNEQPGRDDDGWELDDDPNDPDRSAKRAPGVEPKYRRKTDIGGSEGPPKSSFQSAYGHSIVPQALMTQGSCQSCAGGILVTPATCRPCESGANN